MTLFKNENGKLAYLKVMCYVVDKISKQEASFSNLL